MSFTRTLSMLMVLASLVCNVALADRTQKLCPRYFTWLHRPIEKKSAAKPTLKLTFEKLANSFQARNSTELDPYGIEIEGQFPAAIDTEATDQAILDGIRPFNPEARITPNRTVSDSRNGIEVPWKVVPDDSLISHPGFKPGEFVSPKLISEEDEQVYFSVLGNLKDRAGFRSLPMSGGVHIHVDAPGITPAEVALLVLAYRQVEKALNKAFAIAITRRFNAQPMASDLIDRMTNQDLTSVSTRDFVESFVSPLSFQPSRPLTMLRQHLERARLKSDPDNFSSRDLDTFESRRRGLNVLSLNKHGTIEFRPFNSTVSEEHVRVMSEFCRRFVFKVRAKDPALLNYLASGETISIPKLWQLLDMTSPFDPGITRGMSQDVVRSIRPHVSGYFYGDQN